MKRSGPIPRRTRLRKANPERKRKRFERDFGTKSFWIRTLPCCVPMCHKGWRPDMEAAHAKSRGSGGSALHLVPMCQAHHEIQHSVGVRTFQSEYGLDLLALAAEYESAWQLVREAWSEKQGEEIA